MNWNGAVEKLSDAQKYEIMQQISLGKVAMPSEIKVNGLNPWLYADQTLVHEYIAELVRSDLAEPVYYEFSNGKTKQEGFRLKPEAVLVREALAMRVAGIIR
jgi:hypothetical protein